MTESEVTCLTPYELQTLEEFQQEQIEDRFPSARPLQKAGRKPKSQTQIKDKRIMILERAARNRESAQASRQRKRQHMYELETQNKNLIEESENLKKRLKFVEEQNIYLTNLLENLSETVNCMKNSFKGVGQDILAIRTFKNHPSDHYGAVSVKKGEVLLPSRQKLLKNLLTNRKFLEQIVIIWINTCVARYGNKIGFSM